MSGGSSTYNTPVVDVDMVFSDSRSSAHALGSSHQHQTRSSQRLAVLSSTSASSAAQDLDLPYTVSSSSIHWNKNHASSASSVSSLTVSILASSPTISINQYRFVNLGRRRTLHLPSGGKFVVLTSPRFVWDQLDALHSTRCRFLFGSLHEEIDRCNRTTPAPHRGSYTLLCVILQ